MGLPWRIENFLCAKLVGSARRLKKYRVGDDHRQLRIEQVVKALRRRERDQRRWSVTMILTSTGIAQQRLQNGTRSRQIGLTLRRVGGSRQIEIVLGKRNH
jgi:hypothetical protein